MLQDLCVVLVKMATRDCRRYGHRIVLRANNSTLVVLGRAENINEILGYNCEVGFTTFFLV